MNYSHKKLRQDRIIKSIYHSAEPVEFLSKDRIPFLFGHFSLYDKCIIDLSLSFYLFVHIFYIYNSRGWLSVAEL